MNVFMIAWKSVRQRGLASLLTITSMALGVGLVVMVLTIYGVVTESFRSNSSLGYHLIVGARGGGLQLTLNSVFYLSQPVENIPYEYYLAFLPADERRAELENSIAYRSHELECDTADLLAETSLSPMGGLHALALDVAQEQFRAVREQPMGLDQDGMYANFTGLAIPLCMGDSYGDFRVVGTSPALFDELVYDYERNRKFEFAEGRNFVHHSSEHGYFECVIGQGVARVEGLRVGDTINPVHGLPDDVDKHSHEREFTIVGILEYSGTPNDRAVFVNMEGFFLIEDHINEVDEDDSRSSSDPETSDPTKPKDDEDDGFDDLDELFGGAGTDAPPSLPDLAASAAHALSVGAIGSGAAATAARQEPETSTALSPSTVVQPLPVEQREITAILVLGADPFGGDLSALHIAETVNLGVLEGTLGWSDFRPSQAQRASQAVQPVREIESLFQKIVSPVTNVLLTLTVLICVVSGISILVSMYNSMSERRHEIAVMRALGASRETIVTIVLAESLILAFLGGATGWLGGHFLIWLANPYIEASTGVAVGLVSLVWAEAVLLPGLFLLAVLVGLVPAMSAYRTDVSQSLGK